MKATWQPPDARGSLDAKERDALPASAYAFPKQRKEPLTDAAHVRNALSRFDQVEGVDDADRALAFANIERAAAHFGVELGERRWQDLM